MENFTLNDVKEWFKNELKKENIKIVDYAMCGGDSQHEIEKDVDRLITDGYKPFGSPCVCSKSGYIYQAMVKYED